MALNSLRFKPAAILFIWVSCTCSLFSAELKVTNELENIRAEIDVVFKNGSYSNALPLAIKAVDLANTYYGTNSTNWAFTALQLADLYKKLQNSRDARLWYQQSLAMMERQCGLEHPFTARALNAFATYECGMGNYREAEGLAERSLTIRLKTLGENTDDTADSLGVLGQISFYKGDYDKAEQLFLHELTIKTQVHGSNHVETSTAINNLAILYEKTRNFNKAESLYQQNLKIKETVGATNGVEYATALYNFGTFYLYGKDWKKAEPYLQQCLPLLEKGYGPASTYTVSALDVLSQYYSWARAYAKAEAVYLRSLQIKEQTLGTHNTNTIKTLNALANTYSAMNEHEKAIKYYQLTLARTETVYGTNSVFTAAACESLALLYHNTAHFSAAEELYKRSLQISENALGYNHPKTAYRSFLLSLHYKNTQQYQKVGPLLERCQSIYGRDNTNAPTDSTVNFVLASLYSSLGEYSKSEALFSRTIANYEKTLGKTNAFVYAALLGLAKAHDYNADYVKAEAVFARLLKATQETECNPHVRASVLDTVAWHYFLTKTYVKAEPLFQRALELNIALNGEVSPSAANSLNSLGLLFQAQGQNDKAQACFEKSLKLREKIFGDEHLNVAYSLNNLASILIAMARDQKASIPREALAAAQRARHILEKHLNNILSFGPEKIRMTYTENNSPYSILADLGSAPDVAESMLRNKGIVLDSLVEDELVAQACTNSEARLQLEALKDAELRLITLKPEAPHGTNDNRWVPYQERVTHLQEEIDKLQEGLARRVGDRNQIRRALKVTVPDVQASLDKETVLLEFVKYRHYAGSNQFTYNYGVMLIGGGDARLENGGAGELTWIPLDTTESIDAKVKEYSTTMRDHGAKTSLILRALYDTLWKPIEKSIDKGVKTVIISPDSELSFVNFGTFLDADDRFLAQRFNVRYVCTGRDLVYGLRPGKPGNALVCFANPAFNEDLAVRDSIKLIGNKVAMSEFNQREYQGCNFPPLPGTEAEALHLKANAKRWNLQETCFIGQAATEEQLRTLHSPSVLHLATHGFFLPDQRAKAEAPFRETASETDNQPVVYKNPMQRSCLALTGAQKTLEAWKRGEPPDPSNDGILTAQEVGLLDLRGTWLVVLSACDTGTGKAQAGEGVMGLRRGFMLAGAQNLLMTLWPISDKYAALVMQDFYEQAMQTQQAPDALATVQRKWLIKLREQYGAVMAARLAGPFVMTYQSAAPNRNN